MLFSDALERPACRRCGIRMMLARIAPDTPQSETWSFECPKCERVQTERKPIDPMKACSGWLASELRPPE
jgi:hypothetical protein